MARTAVAQGSRADVVVTGALALLALLALAVPQRILDPVTAVVRRTVGVPLISLQERAERTRSAFLAHDSTSRVIDSLALRTTDLRALEAENARLRALFGLGARVRWGFLATDATPATPEGGIVSAAALGDPLGREVMLTLNVGSRSGVVPYLPVVAPAGLVGRVRSVDPTTSQVILYSHEEFRASAMTADQRVVGIVRPHQGDEGDYLLEMGGVEVRNQLRPGTVIYTSGLGGTFPAYIPIGVVLRELDRAALWERTYLLRPLASPSDIRSVLVILPERVQAGLAGVWVTAPDSAAAAVATVGDSILVDSARADSARYRAAIAQRVLDSLRLAGVNLAPRTDSGATADSVPAGGARPPTGTGGGTSTPAPAPRPAATPPARPAPTPRADSAAARATPPPANPFRIEPRDTAATRPPASRPDSVRPPTSPPPGSRRDRASLDRSSRPHPSPTPR